MKKLWHQGYWDGPISGVCEYNGQKCWFEQIDEFHDKYSDYDDDDFCPPWYRRYLVHKLTDEQFQEILVRHEKWQRMVGTHCDYDEEGKRASNFHYTDTITKETVAQYYEESKKDKFPDITPVSEEYILGWFQW